MVCSMPGFPVHHQLPQLAQTHVHQVGDAIKQFHLLSSPLPPALIFPYIRVFSNESVPRIRWPKYWRLSFSIGPSSEYPGLISFSMNWLNLLVVHRTLKSLIQHHILKPSILWYSAFFMVHLSHPLTISGKTIALTIRTSAGNVMSLLFSVLYGIS